MTESTRDRIKLSAAQVTQLAVWLVTIMLAYSALNARITTLEVKYDRLASDISEIKASQNESRNDIKQLLQRKQP